MHNKKKVILITGACGIVGSKTAESLCSDFQVVGFDSLIDKQDEMIDLIQTNISDEDSLDRSLLELKEKYGNHLASVIHLATYCKFSGGSWDLYNKVNVEGTEKLFKSLRRHNFEVKQFIFCSALQVHSPCKPGEKIDESSPLSPKWFYPKSLLLAEDAIHRLQGDIPCVILRSASIYDEYCHCPALARQLQRIFEKQMESHVFSGNPSHGSPFLHINDLIDAILLIIKKGNELPHDLVLLLAEEKTLSYSYIQSIISQNLFKKKWKTLSLPKSVAKFLAWCLERVSEKRKKKLYPWLLEIVDNNYEVNISRAKKIIGWQPKHDVEESISLWTENISRDPAKFYEENNLVPSEKFFRSFVGERQS